MLKQRLKQWCLVFGVGLLLAGFSAQPATAGVMLNIPTNLTVSAGGTVTVPIILTVTSSPVTLTGITIALSFDNTVFTISNIMQGPFLTTSFGFVTNTSNPGVLIASGSNVGETIGVGSGTILKFDLTAVGGTPGSSYPVNLLATYTNANGTVTTSLEDNNFNTLPLSPAPTNGPNDTVDGLVTINAIPEPSQYALTGLLLGLGGLLTVRKHLRARATQAA